MNRGEVYAAARTMAGRPNMSSDDLDICVQMLEGELNRKLREHPRNLRRASYTLPTEALATSPPQYLRLPTDIARVESLIDSDGNDYDVYSPKKRGNIERGYIPRGDCLEVIPTPEYESVWYLDYYAFLDSISGSDELLNWVTTYYPDVYIFGLLKYIAVYTKDKENLAQWAKDFAQVLEDVVGQGWDQNIGAAPHSSRYGG